MTKLTRRPHSSYRSARRNRLRAVKLLHHPRLQPVRRPPGPVEYAFRAWLMRKHMTTGAPPKPTRQIGPSRSGPHLGTVHLRILKQRVRDEARRKRGIKI